VSYPGSDVNVAYSIFHININYVFPKYFVSFCYVNIVTASEYFKVYSVHFFL